MIHLRPKLRLENYMVFGKNPIPNLCDSANKKVSALLRPYVDDLDGQLLGIAININSKFTIGHRFRSYV